MTFQWEVTGLSVMEDAQGVQNLVVDASYSVKKEGVEYTGTQRFEFEPTHTFKSFGTLTEDEVLGWIRESLGESGVNAIEACIDGQLEFKKNPPPSPIAVELPWATK